MRIVLVCGVLAMLATGLSGCAAVDAGTSVIGTAASVTGDVITAPFGNNESADQKK